MAEAGSVRVCGVLLAAGTSSRFGGDNKLLADIGGMPLIRHVAKRLLKSRLAAIIVVTGFEADSVKDALSGLDLRFAHNPDFHSGIASSLRRGIADVDKDASGAMIVLGDMPGVTTELVDELVEAFEGAQGEKITFPVTSDGRQGNPVIWPKRFFADLLALTGDTGAKRLIAENRDDALGVPVPDDAVLRDIDAPEDVGERGP